VNEDPLSRAELDVAAERREKVLWVVKGGGRWSLDLNEIAWSVRLDQRGREIFPSLQAVSLVQAACEQLVAMQELEGRGKFFRLVLWRHEPW